MPQLNFGTIGNIFLEKYKIKYVSYAYWTVHHLDI